MRCKLPPEFVPCGKALGVFAFQLLYPLGASKRSDGRVNLSGLLQLIGYDPEVAFCNLKALANLCTLAENQRHAFHVG